ncbi:glycoside hydrolase [Achaetomium macrosporum]|uniref:cellulase n=1 Tax=Achaetomium macrosporum TaxID=79813 RepID=A0AAN7C6A8_9PEZI|nr:glycoside hydrolase [Achaetomium macrosporum]
MRPTPVLRTASAAALPLVASAADGKSTRYAPLATPVTLRADLIPVFACDANFNRLTDVNAKSGCDGGSAYSCADQTPWAVNDNLAYGFAATNIAGGFESSWCCACYVLTFTSGPVAGKAMVVQSTSTGGYLGTNHFDLAMPGVCVGIFNGCSSQLGGLPGAQYGGISSRSECDSFPDALKPGCQWRFDWFKNADNPTFTFEQVQCPTELVARTGCKRDDDSKFPVFTPNGGGGSSPSSSASSSPSSTSASSKPSQTSGSCTAQRWAQCGGSRFTACITCVSGTTCQKQNDWYSQCL